MTTTYQLTDAWRKQLAEWRSSDHVLTFVGRPDKPVASSFTVIITQADRDASNRYWDNVDKERLTNKEIECESTR